MNLCPLIASMPVASESEMTSIVTYGRLQFEFRGKCIFKVRLGNRRLTSIFGMFTFLESPFYAF